MTQLEKKRSAEGNPEPVPRKLRVTDVMLVKIVEGSADENKVS